MNQESRTSDKFSDVKFELVLTDGSTSSGTVTNTNSNPKENGKSILHSVIFYPLYPIPLIFLISLNTHLYSFFPLLCPLPLDNEWAANFDTNNNNNSARNLTRTSSTDSTTASKKGGENPEASGMDGFKFTEYNANDPKKQNDSDSSDSDDEKEEDK